MAFGVALAAGSAILKGRLKTPSEKRAKKVLGGVVSAALGGNLVAIKVLDERGHNTGGAQLISKERAVWEGGYNQVASQRPDLIAAYNKAKGSLPAIDNSGPEAAARSIGLSASLPPLEQVVQPLEDAAAANEQAAREALASAAEKIGVGGGAALAQKLRGTAGPLDTLVEFAQKPGGTVALAIGAVVVIVVIARALR